MNKKEIMRNEIINFSPDEQKEYLLKFLDTCISQMQWQSFTYCHWINSSKKPYYVGDRVWTLHENMLNLLKK